MRNLAFAAVALVVILVAPGSARADETADDLIKEGLALRRVGRDEQALPKFERAYRLTPTPRAAAQLGLCRQALGRWVEAENLLSEALDAKEDTWIIKNRSTLDHALTYIRSNIARLVIVGDPEGAEILISGRLVGRLPLDGALRVDPGPMDLEVRAFGFDSTTQKLTIKIGGRETVTVHLKKSAVAAIPPPRASPLAVAVTTASPGPPPTRAESSRLNLTLPPPKPAAVDDASPTPIYKKAWFWGVVGGIVVTGAAAGLLLARRGTDYPKSEMTGTFP